MKIVLIKAPSLFSPIMKKIFKIISAKKQKNKKVN